MWDEYKQEEVCNLFMMFEPLIRCRHVEVTDHRTQVDYAKQIKFMVDAHYPQAIKPALLRTT